MLWVALLEPRDVALAMAEVVRWGFPRELCEADACALWFEPRPGVLVWVEIAAMPSGRLLGNFHLCVRPDLRKRFFPRGVIRGIEQLGAVLHLSTLWAYESEDWKIPTESVGYLERLGWTRTSSGFGKAVGVGAWERP